MNTKIWVVVGCFFLFIISGCTSINGTGMCNTQYGCQRSMICADGPNCECTDPGCYSGSGNFCLSTGTCCRAFGNMGSSGL